MKIFKIEKEVAKHVTHFDSDFLLNPIFSLAGEIKTSFVTLEAGGVIGFHQATVAQFILILSGEGEVCSENRKYQPVMKGHAVFWEQGEWHETISASGLTALDVNHIHLNLSE
ncbi:cupin domain-containing protein [Jeotgalibacillus salarius]|uniref:Cupin domain-containing protein n=1 Tax=Jeotgalibacillus salarius TaxID=546023 RepID=A0A4Y8LJG0_9BACL|nr:cupin domain-containing protein [Jeotgalibacillus salarius]TFE02345.1 cupin domain-containing protein [Jeotgalibacillus salarius]